MPAFRPIHTAADAESLRDAIEEVYDGWYARAERIDWEHFFERVEDAARCDFGDNWNSLAIRRVRRIVQELRKATA